MVEQIDPALVPEYFWRILAMGRPISNPRSTQDIYASSLVELLAWYDRDVAAALFEPLRDQMEKSDDKRLANSQRFRGWSLFDPVRPWRGSSRCPSRWSRAVGSRVLIAELLGLVHEQRWRRIWSDFTEISELFERDLR